MPRNDKVYLEDILSAALKINDYVKGMNHDQFIEDVRTFDAVIRNLEIIGEASKKLSANGKAVYSDIEWRKISGLRDILIHEYFGIDADIVWDIVKHKIPDLLKTLNKA